MVHPLDDVSNLTRALAVDIPFAFGNAIGTCRGWLVRQDRAARRVGESRLNNTQRDLIIEAETIPREPMEGDKFQIAGAEWIVRPRDDGICFTPSDRMAQLFRVYVCRT